MKLECPTLGDRVRSARKACRLSQRALERLCHLKHPTISLIEANRLDPKASVVKRLAIALQVCPSTFYACSCPHAPPANTQESALCQSA